MIKILKTIRNNWKKTVFSIAIFSYGINFANNEYKKNVLIRKYCKEAVKFGDVSLNVLQSPRHIVVILNPSANNRNAKKEYEKYCAPLLHLSGAYVSLLTTNEETNAINLTNKIPNTANAIIIAGGDGTVSEVVTGLLRRKKDGSLQEMLPIGILPVGKTNSLANYLYHNANVFKNHTSDLYRYRIMLEATFSVIKEITNNINVMEIKNVENDNNENELKPVYAVNRLHIGSFRDASVKTDKYWYFNKLRSYAFYLFGSYNQNNPINAELKYTPPCSGCSKCYKNRMDIIKNNNIKNTRWWHVFVPEFRKTADYKQVFKNYENIENPFCDQVNEMSIKSVELSISSKVINGTPSLRINIGPENLNYTSFVKEGWRRIKDKSNAENQSVQQIDAQMFHLSPQNKNETDERWLSIDKEEYEFKKIEVKLLHNILPVFIPFNFITR